MSFEDFDSEESDYESDPETEYLVDSIKNNKRSLAYGLYCKLNAYENHFNNMQNKYKRVALTWLFAAFVGMGYVISGEEVFLPLNSFLGIFLISLLTSGGVFLLWYFDSAVYHRMLGAVITESIKLEKEYPFLGSSHQNMVKLFSKKKDPGVFYGYFYGLTILFLLFIAATSVCSYLYLISSTTAVLIGTLFFLSILIFFIVHHRIARSYGTSSLKNNIKKGKHDTKE